MRRLHRTVVSAVSVLVASCALASDPAETEIGADSEPLANQCLCSLPTEGLYAMFDVAGEKFQQQITNAQGVADAIALWTGRSDESIPIGRLECTCAGWNCRWRFHMDPASIEFAFGAIELCDGIPSYVSSHCEEFGTGYYCPWSARLVDLRDCRTDPSCPRVPRCSVRGC